MKKSSIIFALSILLCIVFSNCKHKKKSSKEKLSFIEHLDIVKLNQKTSNYLKAISDSGTLFRKNLNVSDTLNLLFGNQSFSKKWLGTLFKNQFLNKLADACKTADKHALDPEFYHYDFLKRAFANLRAVRWDTSGKINYDSLSLLMIYSADAFLGFYHDMSCGRVDPAYTGSVDKLPRRTTVDLKALITSDTVESALKHCVPHFKAYTGLQNEYQRLVDFPDNLLGKQIVYDENWQKGDVIPAAQVLAILKKLRLNGYGNWNEKLINRIEFNSPYFNNAIRHFQIMHNLNSPGYFDRTTCAKLNITKATMLTRIAANLERWRWLGPVTEPSRIWVNIGENRVYAWRNDTLKVQMKVCSGTNRDAAYYEKLRQSSKPNSRTIPPDNLETPLLKANLTHFVVNPTWFVPHLIAVKEMLPFIRANPGSLAQYDYIVKNLDGEIVNPYDIDWWAVGMGNFPFRIEQLSGSQNSLGKVVIHFPNAYNIYMHDSPAKAFFSYDERHVSHGCVRLEKPFDMIEFICSFGKKDIYDNALMAAGMEPEHNQELRRKYRSSKGDTAINKLFKEKENEYFMADEKIPVYVVYFTAFMNEMGVMDYTNDAYNRDEKMMRVMRKPLKKLKK